MDTQPMNDKPVPATEWKLPPPPEGMAWHRADGWTPERLPHGYRPLLSIESPIKGLDEWLCPHPKIKAERWVLCDGSWNGELAGNAHGSWLRTRRTLPTSQAPAPDSLPVVAGEGLKQSFIFRRQATGEPGCECSVCRHWVHMGHRSKCDCGIDFPFIEELDINKRDDLRTRLTTAEQECARLKQTLHAEAVSKNTAVNKWVARLESAEAQVTALKGELANQKMLTQSAYEHATSVRNELTRERVKAHKATSPAPSWIPVSTPPKADNANGSGTVCVRYADNSLGLRFYDEVRTGTTKAVEWLKTPPYAPATPSEEEMGDKQFKKWLDTARETGEPNLSNVADWQVKVIWQASRKGAQS